MNAINQGKTIETVRQFALSIMDSTYQAAPFIAGSLLAFCDGTAKTVEAALGLDSRWRSAESIQRQHAGIRLAVRRAPGVTIQEKAANVLADVRRYRVSARFNRDMELDTCPPEFALRMRAGIWQALRARPMFPGSIATLRRIVNSE